MAFNEIIKTGRKYRVCFDSTPGARQYYRLSHWTHANDVEFDNKRTLSEIIMLGDDNTANVKTVYVSAADGNDDYEGSEGRPFRTIQKALSYAPIVNGNAEFRVVVGQGDYDSFYAKNISATLVIDGNVQIIGRPDNQKDTSPYVIEIDSSIIKVIGRTDRYANTLSVKSFGNNNKLNLIYIHNGGRLNGYRVPIKVFGDRGTIIDKDGLEGSHLVTGIYIVSDGGLSLTESDLSFSNTYVAIEVSTNSIFYADKICREDASELNITFGIISKNGGQVAYGTNELEVLPLDTIKEAGADITVNGEKEKTSNGGRIYTGS